MTEGVINNNNNNNNDNNNNNNNNNDDDNNNYRIGVRRGVAMPHIQVGIYSFGW